jgi:hypothetical protein
VRKGCIKALCDLLICTEQTPDPEVVAKCLKGLENILDAGEFCKKRGLNKPSDCGGWKRL